METEIKTHCPICLETVVRVIESDHEVKNNIKCESEYYIHYNNKLIKFKHPKHDHFEKDASRT